MKQLWVCLVELWLLKKRFWAMKKPLLIVGCEKVENGFVERLWLPKKLLLVGPHVIHDPTFQSLLSPSSSPVCSRPSSMPG
jgi:hypothetical protein